MRNSTLYSSPRASLKLQLPNSHPINPFPSFASLQALHSLCVYYLGVCVGTLLSQLYTYYSPHRILEHSTVTNNLYCMYNSRHRCWWAWLCACGIGTVNTAVMHSAWKEQKHTHTHAHTHTHMHTITHYAQVL